DGGRNQSCRVEYDCRGRDGFPIVGHDRRQHGDDTSRHADTGIELAIERRPKRNGTDGDRRGGRGKRRGRVALEQWRVQTAVRGDRTRCTDRTRTRCSPATGSRGSRRKVVTIMEGENEPMMDDMNVALGVSGSISAVKTVELAHELRRRGATVRAVMTESARGIINPWALEFATENSVVTEI